MRTGQDKARRALLKEKFLQRSELTQDWLSNRVREPAEKTLEAFDDVQERGIVHRKAVIALNMNRSD